MAARGRVRLERSFPRRPLTDLENCFQNLEVLCHACVVRCGLQTSPEEVDLLIEFIVGHGLGHSLREVNG